MTVKPPDESRYRVIGGALLLLRQLPCLTGLPVADPGGGGGWGIPPPANLEIKYS